MPTAALLGLLGLFAMIGTAAAIAPTSPASVDRVIRISAAYPDYEVAELAADADVIAVLRPTGVALTRWNNSENEEPETQAESYLYRDTEMDVVDTLRGKLPDRLWVRGVGGTLGDVTMIYDQQVDWVKGETYLVLLKFAEWPTREGTEGAWGTVWAGHGVLRPVDSVYWANAAGKQLTMEDALRVESGP